MPILRAFVFLVSMSVLAAAAGAAEAPIVIRFAHVVAENTPKGIGAERFKQLVEERLAGRVSVEVYPRSQKVNDDLAPLALLFGDIQMAAPSLSKFRSYARALQVYDLPFLFHDIDHIHRFQQSEVGRALLDSMTGRGIKGLAYWDNGMRVVSANKPLRAPEDADGMTFRIEPSSVFQDQYGRIGVVGIPMPFKRVTDAIREGLVDGQENAWSNIYSRRIHELHRYFTEVGHSYLGYMVVTSTEFWDALPPDIRGELETILAEVTEEVNRLAKSRAEGDRQRVLATGEVEVLVPTEADRKQWRDAFTPVWDNYEAQIGREILDAARAAAVTR